MKKLFILFSAGFVGGIGLVFATATIWNTANIPTKTASDTVTYAEFNSLVQTMKGIYRDDAGTSTDYTDDRMGVGVSVPQLSVDVWGAVFVGDSAVGCDSITTGSVRFHDENKRMEFCDGTVWQTIAIETS